MPLAAVTGRREVMQTAERLLISLTYGGEALSLAAAAATLREYRAQPVIAHIWRLGQRLMDGLNAAAAEAGVRFTCHGYAPMAAMAFDVPADEVAATWHAFLAGCAQRGVLFRRGGLNFVTYSHGEADVDQTIDVARQTFAEMQAGGIGAAAAAPAPGSDTGGRGQQAGPWSSR
jgi:glutamate-1-semialdehyde aminotransferase